MRIEIALKFNRCPVCLSHLEQDYEQNHPMGDEQWYSFCPRNEEHELITSVYKRRFGKIRCKLGSHDFWDDDFRLCWLCGVMEE